MTYQKNLTDLVLRYEQGEFIRNKEGSPIQRLLRELTLRVQELEDEVKSLRKQVFQETEMRGDVPHDG